ncbi:MAG: Rossmann-like and DUF2520 domain-containing protein [Chitinispirillaceae bacterium]
MGEKRKVLSVVGCGRTGRTLSRLFNQNRIFDIGPVLNRTVESSERALAFVESGSIAHSQKDVCTAEVIMISVPDDQISSAAQDLASGGCLKQGTVVFHLSGFCSSKVLEPLAECGCETASVHPVRSFADPGQSSRTFQGTPCAVEGTSSALAVLNEAFRGIGGEVFSIRADAKPLYHSATVFLSNYVVALLQSACKVLERTGMSEKDIQKVTGALAPQAVRNFLCFGADGALTGPVARGDIDTIRKEIGALVEYDKLASDLYRNLGLSALTIAERSGSLSSAQINSITQLFKSAQV